MNFFVIRRETYCFCMTGNPEKKQDQSALQAVKREMGQKCTVGTLKWGAHRIMNRRVFSFRAQGDLR